MATSPAIGNHSEEDRAGSVHRRVLRVRDGTTSMDVDAVASEVPLANDYVKLP